MSISLYSSHLHQKSTLCIRHCVLRIRHRFVQHRCRHIVRIVDHVRRPHARRTLILEHLAEDLIEQTARHVADQFVHEHHHQRTVLAQTPRLPFALQLRSHLDVGLVAAGHIVLDPLQLLQKRRPVAALAVLPLCAHAVEADAALLVHDIHQRQQLRDVRTLADRRVDAAQRLLGAAAEPAELAVADGARVTVVGGRIGGAARLGREHVAGNADAKALAVGAVAVRGDRGGEDGIRTAQVGGEVGNLTRHCSERERNKTTMVMNVEPASKLSLNGAGKYEYKTTLTTAPAANTTNSTICSDECMMDDEL